ncbi:MAG: hypothetical protein MJZ68_04820 [archaeon]|nr:hypothetical protein [archaeon]
MTNNLENSAEAAIAGRMSLGEKIKMYIPFYRGYKQKNLRRDEDRAIRDVVAKVIGGAKTDLSNAARATVGDLQAMRDMERVRSKVDRYYSDVKKGVAGYSGFGDSMKILESQLDDLVSWDAQLIDGVEMLKEATETLMNNADDGNDIKSDLRNVERSVDILIDAYRQRDNVMKGLVEQ